MEYAGRHGASGYGAGCRCRTCQRGWATYIRRRRRSTAARRRYYQGPFVALRVYVPAFDVALLDAVAKRSGQVRDDVVVRAVRFGATRDDLSAV